ncbi:serine protease inhibitor Cvsi-2-like isoform X2 [Mercenaria mercenaria]|uniref:serine protease inhibitor Cvsi-2-like isoform X2 n=1 Tax=Mercenaria mercenaria TaxID=6596 RepID=UPI001E1DA342|nr:serine protease inhibitor Cvsi-2-like isoform X2 [Mercenaria mercenaria]
MRVAVYFLAFVIGYTYATTCTTTSDCDTSITSCSSGYTLTCHNTGSGMHCVCVGDSGQAHTCTQQSDCSSGHNHGCHGGNDWHCVDGHCTCGNGGHGGHHPGGQGGK